MRNMARLVAAVVAVGIFISGAVHAAPDTAAGSTKQQKAAIVDVGNKICPVSGEKVDGKNFYEYNGKRYGLCCPMCADTFEAYAKKYSAIADKEAAGK